MAGGLKLYDSSIHGDVVGGNKVVYEAAALTPLEQAIERIIVTYEGNEELVEIIDELAEYFTDRPDREVIGLEEKLVQGDRKELIQNAVYLKYKFDRKVAKQQVSHVAQNVYVHVLSSIITAFEQKIRPLIVEERDKSEIDVIIYDEIILPIYRAVTRFDTMATPEEVSGMLYFLTGKCHLVWSK